MNNLGICVSVCAATAAEFVESVRRAAKLADSIELRCDCLAENELPKILPRIDNLKKQFRNDFIITFRPPEQGGKRPLALRERIKFWEFFFAEPKSEGFYADFEFDIYEIFNLKTTRSIVSHHDFSGRSNLGSTYRILDFTNSDIRKIAVRADDAIDSIAVWKLLERAKSENKRLIPIAMGEAGKWTRVLGLAHGAALTYAALETGKETAGGQITAREMIDIYRVKELNRETRVYGIIGNPVAHSLSPAMHNAAFKFRRLNSVYVPFEVKNLGEFICRMVEPETREVDLNFAGFSVTAPHKTEIMEYLDETDETARRIGAVNTVKIEDGALCGFNTDAEGFIKPLRQFYGALKNARVAVFGAGGAGRAAIYALQSEGADVTVFARNVEKAKILADEFKVQSSKFKVQSENYNDFDIVVNTTPVGTRGEFQDKTPATASQIENVRLVYDLIYNPVETRFLKEAKIACVQTVGGLAMLAAQGARQFEIWTGLDAPLKEMSAAALRKLS